MFQVHGVDDASFQIVMQELLSRLSAWLSFGLEIAGVSEGGRNGAQCGHWPWRYWCY